MAGRPVRLMVGVAILAASAALQPVRLAIVRGSSMEPTYHTGDLLLTTPCLGRLDHGDVVVAMINGVPMVKRVQRVAGEGLVQCRFGGVWMDVETPMALRSALRQRYPLHIAIVPEGHVFLAGDNQADSFDSYDYGPVPLSAVKRRVLDAKPYDFEKLDWSRPVLGEPVRGVEVAAVLVSAALCQRVERSPERLAVR